MDSAHAAVAVLLIEAGADRGRVRKLVHSSVLAWNMNVELLDS